jgi:hypothetical protein
VGAGLARIRSSAPRNASSRPQRRDDDQGSKPSDGSAEGNTTHLSSSTPRWTGRNRITDPDAAGHAIPRAVPRKRRGFTTNSRSRVLPSARKKRWNVSQPGASDSELAREVSSAMHWHRKSRDRPPRSMARNFTCVGCQSSGGRHDSMMSSSCSLSRGCWSFAELRSSRLPLEPEPEEHRSS